VGFEPTFSGSEEQKPTVSALPFGKEAQFEAVDWVAFENWLLQNHRERIAKDIVSYAKRYAHCLLKRDLSEVAVLRKTLRHHVVKALSNLAKFLGVYEEYRRLVRSYGISWKGRTADELIIDRLVKVSSPDEIFEWVKQVKRERFELETFMDFIAVTGLRLEEAVSSYNLIVKLAGENRLGEYYNMEKQTLEHFKFKDAFIRRTKKAFISFAPKTLVQKIAEQTPLKSKFMVQKLIQNRGLPVRFGDVREAWATFMTQFLRREEIDFLQGRVSANIFMQHYYNPALLGDLQTRAFQGIREIQAKISM
jgi:intergrase/recombinase